MLIPSKRCRVDTSYSSSFLWVNKEFYYIGKKVMLVTYGSLFFVWFDYPYFPLYSCPVCSLGFFLVKFSVRRRFVIGEFQHYYQHPSWYTPNSQDFLVWLHLNAAQIWQLRISLIVWLNTHDTLLHVEKFIGMRLS